MPVNPDGRCWNPKLYTVHECLRSKLIESTTMLMQNTCSLFHLIESIYWLQCATPSGNSRPSSRLSPRQTLVATISLVSP
ncbi:hypothetical protein ASPSYDRAFT_1151729 [Aspergillus sydowii CBS 593.65]|uniref:Uncharacterized protein n=1 Tax=Aspergillus sydowii CBS 593.65 TaxID=1036612 RepID=A0A1L9TB89_9EURO|nr:uncharacterized protein ASPSYDRAFT_1151729 [Aspergillus sydowii CBS 593.65]OJJ56671.1 hypothetical protein ASPSYDRAFT_1151729 [Aspergillus sydowii CBS 593.65]